MPNLGQTILVDSDRDERVKANGMGSRLSELRLHLGLLPIILAMPLMYWPQVIESDTQPWVSAGALASAILFWPRGYRFEKARTLLPVVAAIACAILYLNREPDPALALRYTAILVTFVALWLVAARGGERQVAIGFRVAIVLWFLVGLYQVIALRLGLPIELFGRFVGGRGGVPSLTAEPSFYGSISVLQLMYLVRDGRHRLNLPYYAMAVMSVLLSGSLLSYLFLLIPLARLPRRYLLVGAFALLLMFAQGARVGESGFFNRVTNLANSTAITSPLDIVQRDTSTNLRFGHVKFTLVDELPSLLLLRQDSSFRRAYNNWAFSERGFVYNESDFILTSLGELIFRTGFLGLILGLILIRVGWRSAETTYGKIEKVGLMALCFLSPVSLANPFFVFFIAQRGEVGRKQLGISD